MTKTETEVLRDCCACIDITELRLERLNKALDDPNVKPNHQMIRDAMFLSFMFMQVALKLDTCIEEKRHLHYEDIKKEI